MYLTPAGRRARGDLLDEMDDVVILVEPTQWLSWDLTGFMDRLAGRTSTPSPPTTGPQRQLTGEQVPTFTQS